MYKISLVSADNNNGGAARATRRLVKGLSKHCLNNKFRYEFICNGSPEIGYSQKKPFYKWYSKYFYSNNSIQPIAKIIFNKIWNKFNLLKTTNGNFFFRIGNSINYKITFKDSDLMHLFWGQTFINPEEIAKLDKPVIVTLHDMWFINGGFAYSDNIELDKKINLNYLGKQNFDNQFNMKIKLLNKKNTKIVVTSNWMRQKVIDSGFDENKITKILNYIPNHYSYLDAQEMCQKLLGWSENIKSKTIIYFSGSIYDSRKGFNYFIKAIKELNNEFKSQIAIQILGHNFAKVNELENLNIEYKVLGSFSDELSQVIGYNSADVLICPSLMDNTPNVIAEAQMCGLPCIALEGSGSAEMIDPNISGILASKNNISELSKIIENIVLKKNKFDRLYISSKASQKYSVENTCKKYEELYASLL